MKRSIALVLAASFAIAAALLSFRGTGNQHQAPQPKSAEALQSNPTTSTPEPAHKTGHTAATTVFESESPAKDSSTNLLVRLMNGDEAPKLTEDLLQKYLQSSHRSPDSLLAALRTTGNRKFLLEALERFPNDARVNYAALFDKDLTPEQHRQTLENFKKSDPDNAMAYYLSSLDNFRAGRSEEALQEIHAASAKSGWHDYSSDFSQNAEEAFRSAGYSDADAKTAAMSGLLLPDLPAMKELGNSINDLAKTYRDLGNAAGADALLQMSASLGQSIASPNVQPLITTLVGLAIERRALAALDPGTPYGDTGPTIQDRIAEIDKSRASVRELTQKTSVLYQQMTPEDISNYFDRLKTLGEVQSMRWLLTKYGTN